jgi:hypothetical protein
MTPSSIELHFLLRGPPPAVADVLDALSVLDDLPPVVDEQTAPWKLVALGRDERWTLEPARALTLPNGYGGLGDLSPAARAALLASKWSLVIRGDLPAAGRVERFRRLLEIGASASSEVIGVLDPGAAVVHEMRWLREATTPGVPLGPDALFRVGGHGDGDEHWLYTRGLRRCGMPELELLGVAAEHLQTASALLGAVASRAILHGMPTMGEEVLYGHNLAAAVVPWRYAHPDLEAVIGGPDDRDEEHPDSDLVLVFWEATSATTGVWRSVTDVLEEDDPPIFLLTEYETERLEALSRLRWRSFASLVDTYGNAKGWRFLAKFGYGGADGTTREHLWFDVHGADALTAEATLINSPFQDLGLAEGERGRHSIDRLTDFRVGSPVGTATPESLDRLLRALVATMDAESH